MKMYDWTACRRALRLRSLAFLLTIPVSLTAQTTYTWSGAQNLDWDISTQNWTVGGNPAAWVNGTANVAEFTTAVTVDVTTGITLNSLRPNNAPFDAVITVGSDNDSALIFDGSTPRIRVTRTGTVPQGQSPTALFLNANIQVVDTASFGGHMVVDFVGNGIIHLNGRLDNTSRTLAIGGGSDPVSTVILSADNTYDGVAGTGMDAMIQLGNNSRLGIGHNSALGTGLLNVNSANTASSFVFAHNEDRVIPNAIRFGNNDMAVTFTGAQSLTFTNNVTLRQNSTSAMGVDPGTPVDIQGSILRGQVSSTDNFIKTGLGTLLLSGGTHTYIGTTTVSAGTLLLNGVHAGAGDYSVSSGGTLGGTGTVNLASGKLLTVQTGGTLSPGTPDAPVGTLTVNGDATIESNTTYSWDFANGTGDRVTVSGTLTLPTVVTTVVQQVTGALPSPAVLFSAGTLAGETDLSGWVVEGLSHHTVEIQNNAVVLVPPPSGTVIMMR